MNFMIIGAIFVFLMTVMVAVVYSAIGAWIFIPFFVIILVVMAFILKGKMKPPEEIIFEIEEKDRRMQERLKEDQKWYGYLSSITCIICGKTKAEGAQLCDQCCPLCGQKKTKKALICKNCLKQVPRDDMLGLSQGGGPTKREIRIAISSANIPGRIQKMLEATERGEVLEYGPDMNLGPDSIEDQEIEAAYEETEEAEVEEEAKGEDDGIECEVKGGGEKMSGSGDPEQW